MIEFVTLFLGLVLGRIEVELVTEGPVAEVVLELDGTEVGRSSADPWKLEVDLGRELLPHRLTARALDAHGTELDRAVQYLNLYRPPAEVRLVTHRNSAGWVTMVGLLWESRARARLARWSVTLDGRRLAADDPKKIWLPPLDPQEFHVVETEIEFSDGVVATDQIGIGGHYLEESSAQLTAKLVTVDDPAETPAPESTRATLTATGERQRVVAIDRGDTEIVFVRDSWAHNGITRLVTVGSSGASRLAGARSALAARVIRAIPLAPGERIRVLYPEALERDEPGVGHLLFSVTPAVDRSTGGGLYWHLTSGDPETDEKRRSRLTDGIAIAGSQAASVSRRRAVVLVLDPGSRDEGSWLDAARVRGYLEALGVPLHVWYLGKAEKSPAEWGSAESVRTLADMERALGAVRASLERQRIVWVDGLHLPDEISVEFGDQGAASESRPGGPEPPLQRGSIGAGPTSPNRSGSALGEPGRAGSARVGGVSAAPRLARPRKSRGTARATTHRMTTASQIQSLMSSISPRL